MLLATAIQSFQCLLCLSQCPFSTRKKHVLHPIIVGWRDLAVPHFVGEQGSEPTPIRVFAAFQILTSFGNRLFKTLDAIKNSLLLRVHKRVLRFHPVVCYSRWRNSEFRREVRLKQAYEIISRCNISNKQFVAITTVLLIARSDAQDGFIDPFKDGASILAGQWQSRW